MQRVKVNPSIAASVLILTAIDQISLAAAILLMAIIIVPNYWH